VSRMTQARPDQGRPDAERTASLCGLILAAGEGRRFGPESKLLVELDGLPLLEHAIRAQCAVPELSRVVVVLGAHAEELLKRVDFGRAEPVLCKDWREGQAASLRRGLQALGGAKRVLVTLGDQPLLTAEVIARFVEQPPGARALYGGRPGHPVVLGREEMAALMTLTGDRGARSLLSGPQIELGALGDFGQDVDTPLDLERIRNEARAVI
jgi:molybdenum cofactor cytidylyltransferase